jgi:hypothetical protein
MGAEETEEGTGETGRGQAAVKELTHIPVN